ncbi:hypothetical protein BLNAU_9799 [Blattamonas nauphoetae]|uniref:Uncharacterized protein n=1 Tax=Blattamonas nauphoetae TaxID=2049346 RepID=A0ABQ9XUT3_9EUKA|nr:hypothetical protein BLNAU_9799 [Blattamonas nauphoetae]
MLQIGREYRPLVEINKTEQNKPKPPLARSCSTTYSNHLTSLYLKVDAIQHKPRVSPSFTQTRGLSSVNFATPTSAEQRREDSFQLISVSPVGESHRQVYPFYQMLQRQLDAADLGTFKASKRLLFGHGPECNVLCRVESISASFICDIVRHAFVIANDPPHLLHHCMPDAHDISLSPVTTFIFIIISNFSCFLFHTVHTILEQRKQSFRARGTGRDRDSTPPCTTTEHVSNSSEEGR